MSRRLVLRPLAESDLRAIWDHTATYHGQVKAESYLNGMGRLFSILADHPEIARERGELRPPVRIHPYQSHLVIFISTESTFDVIRVVHNRSNWAELLSD